jgi:hypothetical protein
MRVTVEDLIAQLQAVKDKKSFVKFQVDFSERGDPKLRHGVQRVDEFVGHTTVVLDRPDTVG